jgi:hypothetical protein
MPGIGTEYPYTRRLLDKFPKQNSQESPYSDFTSSPEPFGRIFNENAGLYPYAEGPAPPQPLEEQTTSAVERNDYYSLLWAIKSISMDSTIAVRSSIIAILIIIIAIIPHVVPIVARLHGA